MAIRTDRLTRAMDDIGVSQSEVARRVQVTPATIQQILSGKSKNSVHMPGIAKALGVSLDWLLDKSDFQYDYAELNANAENVPGFSLTRTWSGIWEDLGLINMDKRVAPFENSDDEEDAAYVMFTELGDDMAPTFRHGDFIMVHMREKKLREPEDFWVLGDATRVSFIRRIRRLPDGHYRLTHDGAPGEAEIVNPADVRIIGRVVWASRLL